MPSENVVIAANVLQSAVPVLSLIAYLPQWHRLIVTRSSGDFSLRAWLSWTVTASFSCFYAVVQYLVNGRGVALIFSTAASLTFIAVTVYLIFTYRRKQAGA